MRPRVAPAADDTYARLVDDVVEIVLTQGNINNNHVYLSEHLDFFHPRHSAHRRARRERAAH
jgi:hypothetical protein